MKEGKGLSKSSKDEAGWGLQDHFFFIPPRSQPGHRFIDLIATSLIGGLFFWLGDGLTFKYVIEQLQQTLNSLDRDILFRQFSLRIHAFTQTPLSLFVMDPVSAIGLAGTILSFVTFAAKLVSKVSAIHNSTTEPEEIVTARLICDQLKSFSSTLAASSVGTRPGSALKATFESTRGTSPDESFVSAHLSDTSLNDVAKTCRDDCDRLLSIMDEFDMQDDKKSTWSSIRLVLKIKSKQSEIDKIDKRLQRSQGIISLVIGSNLGKFQEEHAKKLDNLNSLCSRYGLQQQSDFEEIKRLLTKLEMRDATARGGELSERGIEDIQNRMTLLSIKCDNIEKQGKVVRSLSFEMRSARQERIPGAHNRTFSWAFNECKDLAGSQLGEWLRTGQGIFWVTGKPGAGKSTFMKFVASHRQTHRCLGQWSLSQKAIIASHYFWFAGTPMQKSLKGLLQSLLFDVFRQQPGLVEQVCGERWKDSDRILDPWTLTELHSLITRLGQTANLPFKLCFFIDGLDEYNGDHLDFVQDLVNLSKSPNIKICAASRPLNVFEDVLGNDKKSKLTINDLTKGDIRSYSTACLCEHPRWNYLATRTANAESLIDEIVERSRGVFLWVFLAVRMLRDGLTNDDSFSDLLRRLTLTPVDLEQFFKQMLSTVEPFYDEKMAGTLRMAISARAPLDLLIFSFYDHECDDEGYTLKLPCRILSFDEKHALRVQAIRRINGYTRGLLQAHGCKVDFLHRTVADFLKGREMSDFLESKSSLGFSPELSLLKSYLAWVKSEEHYVPVRFRPGHYADVGELHLCVEEALACASSTPETSPREVSVLYRLLDQLESSLCQDAEALDETTDDGGSTSVITASNRYFREMVLKSELPGYVRRCLLESPDYFDVLDKPPIHVLLNEKNPVGYDGLQIGPSRHLKTLSILLECGQDPNEHYAIDDPSSKQTAWSMTVRRLICGPGTVSEDFTDCLRAGLFKLFLEHGANPNALIYRSGFVEAIYTTAWVDFLFTVFYVEYSELELEEAYLETLKMFLESKPELNIPMSYVVTEEVTQNWPSGHVTKGLLYKATYLVLNNLQEGEWPVDWNTVHSVFGERRTSILRRVNSVANTEIEIQESNNREKRAASLEHTPSTESRTMGKRRRML
ncbi:hypothetical protein PG989_004776 [Apiospora arundinis]